MAYQTQIPIFSPVNSFEVNSGGDKGIKKTLPPPPLRNQSQDKIRSLQHPCGQAPLIIAGVTHKQSRPSATNVSSEHFFTILNYSNKKRKRAGVSSDRWTHERLLRNGRISTPGLCGAAVSFTGLPGKMAEGESEQMGQYLLASVARSHL